VTTPEQLPKHDKLADEHDQLGWDRDKHGRMRDYATDDAEVRTVPAELEG
jgi:hypothetical protein